jgi:hypothetical protein
MRTWARERLESDHQAIRHGIEHPIYRKHKKKNIKLTRDLARGSGFLRVDNAARNFPAGLRSWD